MQTRLCIATIFVTIGAIPCLSADKNGVSPQAISLPSGPGSINGLGESFQPQLNTGGGSYSVPLVLPPGPAGHAPQLSLQYHAGNGNGPLGIGWSVSTPSVSRSLDRGVPFYVDAANGVDDDRNGQIDNLEEIDRIAGVDGEELVPLSDGFFRSENESTFHRYQRLGSAWNARSKDGDLLEFGTTTLSRVHSDGNTFRWLLDKHTDLNGNAIRYSYLTDSSSAGQKYIREVQWGSQSIFYSVVFSYESGRPDIFTDFLTGFEIRTALRLTQIDVIAQGMPATGSPITGDLNGDGNSDFLIRRYTLQYDSSSGHSLLQQVRQLGDDGATDLPPTGLPPTTFAYTQWVPPHNVAASVTFSVGDPQRAMNDPSVDLIDINRDGLPDLLDTESFAHSVYYNLGVNAQGLLAWSTPVPVLTTQGAALNIDLASPGIHLADMDSDGLSDITQKITSISYRYFRNTGATAWQAPATTLSTTTTWPLWPFDGATGLNARSLDIDHNRFNDILFTDDSIYRLWLLLPNGQYAQEISPPILTNGGQTFKFELPGTKIADMNGDRLQDLVWIQPTRVLYWFSKGRGNFVGPRIVNLDVTLTAADIDRSGLTDVNGDGLADLTVVRPITATSGLYYWLNIGESGFSSRRIMTGLPPFNANDALRWADMNGNGSGDIVISNGTRPAGLREQFIDLIPGVRPNLLRQVSNGLGLTITINYESSIQQMLNANQGGSPWTKNMPISVPIVSQISEDDSRGNVNIKQIRYRDPFYRSAKQEFRGFAYAEITELGDASAPTKVTKHWFDTGETADCRKGQTIQHEITNAAGNVFVRTQNTIIDRTLATGTDGATVRFAFPGVEDTFTFEGGPTSVQSRKTFDFDDYGNPTQDNDHGILSDATDDIFVSTAYDYRPAIWLMNLPQQMTTRGATAGPVVADERFTHDPNGNMTLHENWLNTEDRWIHTIENIFDAWGNVILATDPNGHFRSFTIDPYVHIYPTAEMVHLAGGSSLVASANYHLGFGTIASSVDFAGASSSFSYDRFGRLAILLRPGGARTTYDYLIGHPVSSVVTKVLESVGGGTYDSYQYSDGYGRKLGNKVEGENGQWRYLDAVDFNSRKLERSRWLPHYSATYAYETPSPTQTKVAMEYDVPNRLVRLTNPDGTFSRTLYEPYVKSIWDENDNAGAGTPMSYRTDGRGRLIEVTERNGPAVYLTHYAWSTLGDLLTTTDTQDNVESVTYDSLRRKLFINNPDRGHMTYAYDDAGRLLQTTDANTQVIRYTYDFANRLLTENYWNQGGGPNDPVDVTYIYDTASNNVDLGDGTSASATLCGGRLSAVHDLSGETHNSYDERGNILWTIKKIKDPILQTNATFTTHFAYDLLDRMSDLYYPDNDHIHFSYNSASSLEQIDGGPLGRVVVSGIDYEPTGQYSVIQYGNGVQTRYIYDIRDRLSETVSLSPMSGELIHYNYTYDAAVGISQIVDGRPASDLLPIDSPLRNTQVFQHDDMGRLTQVRYARSDDINANIGQVNYFYDAIGNLISQTTPPVGMPGHIPEDDNINLGAIAFGGSAGASNRIGREIGDPPGPHSITSTINGHTFEYDSNGNVTRNGMTSIDWDYLNRPVSYSQLSRSLTFIYDSRSKAVARKELVGDRLTRSLFPSPYFESRPNFASTKYCIVGNQRIAQVKGTLDFSRERLQQIPLVSGWNLITLSVHSSMTSQQILGDDSTSYYWDGVSWELVATGIPMPFGVPLWVYVPSNRIKAVRGAYDTCLVNTPVNSAPTMIAWPRLEPFSLELNLVPAGPRVFSYDQFEGDWLTHGLPAFLNNNESLSGAPATAYWIMGEGSHVSCEESIDREVIFFHGDHLGSISVTTDLSGQVMSQDNYYPFGLRRLPRLQSDEAHESYYGFAGRELDEKVGFAFLGSRLYDPKFAKFLSPDPLLTSALANEKLITPQSVNPYSYCQNRPIVFCDPTGWEAETWSEQLLQGVSNFLGVGGLTDAAIESRDQAREIDRLRSAPIVKGKEEEFIRAEDRVAQIRKSGIRTAQKATLEGFKITTSVPFRMATKSAEIVESEIVKVVSEKTQKMAGKLWDAQIQRVDTARLKAELRALPSMGDVLSGKVDPKSIGKIDDQRLQLIRELDARGVRDPNLFSTPEE